MTKMCLLFIIKCIYISWDKISTYLVQQNVCILYLSYITRLKIVSFIIKYALSHNKCANLTLQNAFVILHSRYKTLLDLQNYFKCIKCVILIDI